VREKMDKGALQRMHLDLQEKQAETQQLLEESGRDRVNLSDTLEIAKEELSRTQSALSQAQTGWEEAQVKLYTS
jgi:hypothetical protein